MIWSVPIQLYLTSSDLFQPIPSYFDPSRPFLICFDTLWLPIFNQTFQLILLILSSLSLAISSFSKIVFDYLVIQKWYFCKKSSFLEKKTANFQCASALLLAFLESDTNWQGVWAHVKFKNRTCENYMSWDFTFIAWCTILHKCYYVPSYSPWMLP